MPLPARRNKLIEPINFDTDKGLEIGPLISPLLKKQDVDVYYADHCSTEELIKKYEPDEKVDTTKIVDIDYIWNQETIDKLAKSDDKFDFIIASHVVEHIPNLIKWFSELYAMLKPGGIVSLAAPHRKYTFDCYRQETTTSQLVAAYVEGRTKPSAMQIYDHFSNHSDINTKQAWLDKLPEAEVDFNDGDRYLRAYQAVIQSEQNADFYMDSHCSVFTEKSFLNIIAELVHLDLFHFKIEALHVAEPFEREFQVILKKVDKNTEGWKEEIFASLPINEIEKELKPTLFAHIFDFLREIKKKLKS